MNYPHKSHKIYGHERGLSCCFRQWKADSHCNLIHGYSLAFELHFAAEYLDDRNWVVDFGGLKEIEEWLKKMFDHTMLVSFDDPEVQQFIELRDKGLIDLRLLNAVGCESIALLTYEYVESWLRNLSPNGNIRIEMVTVREHGSNGASYAR